MIPILAAHGVQKIAHKHDHFKYELTAPLQIYSKRVSGTTYRGNYVTVINNLIIVKAGFMWDGATGIHDGKKDINGIPTTWKASCVHDALFREKYRYNLKLTDKTIDKIFRDELKKCGFKWWWLWYAGVRIFGRFARGKKK